MSKQTINLPAKFRENVDFSRGSFRDSGDDTSIRDAEIQALRKKVRELEAEVSVKGDELEWLNRQLIQREDIIKTFTQEWQHFE